MNSIFSDGLKCLKAWTLKPGSESLLCHSLPPLYDPVTCLYLCSKQELLPASLMMINELIDIGLLSQNMEQGMNQRVLAIAVISPHFPL